MTSRRQADSSVFKEPPTDEEMRTWGQPRAWLIAATAFVLVAVVLVLGNRSFKATEQATFEEFNQLQLVLAQEATGGVELYFEVLAEAMKSLREHPEVQRFDETATRREIQHEFDELQALGVTDIGVLNADGVLRYNVAAPEIEGLDFSWRQYYQETKTRTADDTYIVEFIEFQGVDAGQLGVLVAVPMFQTASDAGSSDPPAEFAGVAVCTLKLDTLTQRFISPIQSSERGHAFLIDDEYNLLWSPDSSLFGKSLLNESEAFLTFQHIVERMAVGEPGTGQYYFYAFEESSNQYTAELEEKLIAYAPARLGEEVWTVGVWAPKEDARALIRTVYVRQLTLVGVIILIVLAGSGYALGLSSRVGKLLEEEVEAKTRELRRQIAERTRAEDALKQRNRELAILNAISATVSQSLDLNRILEDALDEVLRLDILADEAQGMLFLVNEGSDALTLTTHRGAPVDHPCLASPPKMGECLCGLAVQQGEVIISDDCWNDERHTRRWPTMPAHKDISLPLMVRSNRALC
jgi:hypothetical protein